LQIYKGEEFYKYSLENRLRKEVTEASRGLMFSRDNEVLVYNVPRFDVIITPQYIKNKVETIEKLSDILDMPVTSIEAILKKNSGQASYRPVTIKKNVSRKEVAIIETENAKMPGISITTVISREYTDGNVGAHLLGYISEISQNQLPQLKKRDNFDYRLGDTIGQSGLEEKLDLDIRGEDGYEYMEVDARGRKRRVINSELFTGIEMKSAQAGNNVRLTIDRDVQMAAVKGLEGKVGAAVAISTETGEILAMVSTPAFHPAHFSLGISKDFWNSLISDPDKPLLDRAIQSHYSPGSTFKTITLIAALESGTIDENFEVNCNGKFPMGSRPFHCWKKSGHGRVGVHKSLVESCDVFFYKIATKLDIDVLAKYSKLLGFGSKSEIFLPREIAGLIPSKEWKRKRFGADWHMGETLSCVIGQSYVNVTPLQLAMSYAAIANGGHLFRPYVYKEIFSNDGQVKKKVNPELIRETGISQKTLEIVRKALNGVVNEPNGTAFAQKGRGIHMAGKTGTSQVVSVSADKIFNRCEDKEYQFRHHGLFAGFAPFDNPKIAVAVIVEHGCHGSSAAGPVAKEMISSYMKKYQPELYQAIIKKDEGPNASLIKTVIENEDQAGTNE
jgi:penicillin-binding protein 2